MRRRAPVIILATVQNCRAEGEDEGREQEGEPEPDVALGVGHANLADKRTDIDEEVEPIVNPSRGDRRVDNHALAFLGRYYSHLFVWELLGNERRNVGLETTSSKTHDDQPDQECGERALAIRDDSGRGGRNEDQMANESNTNRDDNCVKSSQERVGNPSSEKRKKKRPELVERHDT